jgi:hypothetical protein
MVIKPFRKRPAAPQRVQGMFIGADGRINGNTINSLVKKLQQPAVFGSGVSANFYTVPIGGVYIPGYGSWLGVYFKKLIKSGQAIAGKLQAAGGIFKIINLFVFKYMLLNMIIQWYSGLGGNRGNEIKNSRYNGRKKSR